MPRLILLRAAFACAIWAASGALVQVGQKPVSQSEGIRVRLAGFEVTQAWFRLVRAHEIGEWDASAAQVASLPAMTLSGIAQQLHLIHRLLEAAATKGDTSIGTSSQTLKLGMLAPLMGLTDDELDLPANLAFLADPGNSARRTITRIMTRAAMLHTRIALQDVEDTPTTTGTPASRASRPMLVAPQLSVSAVRIRDGVQTRIVDRSVHWAIAREAFDIVLPPPAAAELTQLWYHAAMSYMQGERNYASLRPHLEHAREVLPADAAVFLFSGAAYENVAAPAVQAALDEDAGSRVMLESPPELMKKAEQYLRRALELDPRLAAARLRLGHVLGLTSRPEEACALLREAEGALTEPAPRYYAALYLGRAEESRGRDRDAEARAAYGRASALFPRAQSPWLALASMAWRGSDQDGAAALLRALSGSNPPDPQGDPLWAYDVSHVGEVTASFKEVSFRAIEAVK